MLLYEIHFVSNCSAFVGLTVSYNRMHGTYNTKFPAGSLSRTHVVTL
jgi:hypothetical protein